VLKALFRKAALLALLCASLAPAAQAQVTLNSQEQAIFNLMKNASGQRRASVELDPILCKVARAKANDMAARGYFNHTDPSGRGPNFMVRQAGYVLPAGYSTAVNANNIESISAGRATAGENWSAWMGSSGHRNHLLGEASFYAAQTSVGVGFVSVPGSEWQYYAVVLSAPPSGPQLTVSSPKSNGTVNESFATVTGTTAGEPDAASVQVRVENVNGEGAWVTAQGTKSWTANVDGLVAGANSVRVRSLDNGGDVLKEVVRNFRYVVLTPVTINVNGNGTVTTGFAGTTQREVGRSYTITATPKAGQLFRGWTGAVTSISRTITFTAVEGGTTINAEFIANPFIAGAGSYSTLFTGTDGTRGAVSVVLVGNGTFTGRVRLENESVAIKGRFDVAGAAQVIVKSKSGKIYTLSFNYANSGITGSISSEGFSADLSLDALSKVTTTRNEHAGRYTLVVAASDVAGAPTGDGSVTIAVSATGAATVSGVLADGTPLTATGRVTSNGKLQIFAPLYTAKDGVFTGTLTFRAENVSDVAGAFYWTRPTQELAPTFAAGFEVQVNAVGSRYIAPVVNQTVLPVSSSTDNTALALEDVAVQTATLTKTNTVTIAASEVTGLSVKVNPLRGNFSGKFVHPTTGKSTTIRGVILQKQSAGFGFFIGGTEAGYATFAPAEVQASLAE